MTMLQLEGLTIPVAKRVLRALLLAATPVILWGAPGVGKSDMVADLAKELTGGVLVDIRAAQYDAVDLRGVPSVDDGRTLWNIPALLPDAARDGLAGILFLDELTNARLDVQAALYQLILDRRLGDYVLPAGWHIVAAGNRVADRAAASRMSSALANRLAHVTIRPDVDAWCEWAAASGIHPALIAFLRLKPDWFHVATPDALAAEPPAFPTPRSWTRCAPLMTLDAATRDLCVAANVGKAAATMLSGFMVAWESLRDLLPAIFADPATAPIPRDPGVLHAVAAALGRKAARDMGRFRTIATYLSRLPDEYAACAILDAVRLEPRLQETESFLQWAARNPGVVA